MNRLLDSSFYFWSVYFNEELFKEVGSDFRRIRVVKPVVELSLLHRISSPLSRCSVPFTFMLAALALFHSFRFNVTFAQYDVVDCHLPTLNLGNEKTSQFCPCYGNAVISAFCRIDKIGKCP